METPATGRANYTRGSQTRLTAASRACATMCTRYCLRRYSPARATSHSSPPCARAASASARPCSLVRNCLSTRWARETKSSTSRCSSHPTVVTHCQAHPGISPPPDGDVFNRAQPILYNSHVLRCVPCAVFRDKIPKTRGADVMLFKHTHDFPDRSCALPAIAVINCQLKILN